MNRRHQSPSAVVLWVSLATGLVLVGLTPPFETPDEPNHFYRAYQISEGTLVSQRLTTSVGGVLPRTLGTVMLAVTGDVPFHPDVKPDRRAWAAAFKTPLTPEDRVELPFPNTALTGPTAYLPQALGIAFGNLLGVSTLTLLYFGRAMTLLLCAIVTALAIRMISARPWTCVMLSLLPMTLFVRSSIASDGPTLALAMLAIALCCQLAGRSPGSAGPSDAWPLYLVAALLALGKPPYAAVTLLALAVPAQVFRSRRAHATTLLTLIAVVVTLQAAWLVALRGRVAISVPGSDPAAQLAHVLENPAQTAALIVSDLVASAPVLLHELIGVLGWLDAPVAQPVAVLLGLAILLVALSETPLVTVRMRWAAGVIGLGGILALQAMNYVYWTPPGALHVEGLQGRHMAAFVPLLLLAVPAPAPLTRRLAPVRPYVVTAFVVVAAAATVQTVLRRYYF